MNDLQERFNVELTHILKQNNLQGQKLAAAVSGGADSLALAFLLKRYAEIFNLGFVVLTVHHHLRPEADEETDYVANLMKKNNILHRTLHWLHEEINTGIETKARKAKTILEKGNKVKISLRFFGRMIVHQDLGKDVIERFVESLSDCSTVESPIRLDGRTLFAVIAPKTNKN